MTTEMSDNETVDDVLADMLLPRFDAITAMRANNYDEIKSLVANYRDRIKAAYKREVEKFNSVIQATVSSSDADIDHLRREKAAQIEFGNVAKLREALGKLRAELWNNTVIAGKKKFALYEIADLALAKPPRNCDVGAAEEQRERFGSFCKKDYISEDCPYGCPLYRMEYSTAHCPFAWAQMPYKEGETNGSK